MAYLVLQNGKVFSGEFFTKAKSISGEVVFFDNMVGYEQVLTDKNNQGKIAVFSYPLIGNYGLNSDDMKDKTVYVKGVIAKEFCLKPSNFRCDLSIKDFFVKNKVCSLCDMDTREIVRFLSSQQKINGMIVSSFKELDGFITDAKVLKSVQQVMQGE